MTNVSELQALLAEYESSSDGLAMEIRLQFAHIITAALRKNRWSQRALANKANMPESTISEIVHADCNCQFDTIAKVLHALGVRVSIAAWFAAEDDGALAVADVSRLDPESEELSLVALIHRVSANTQLSQPSYTSGVESHGQEEVPFVNYDTGRTRTHRIPAISRPHRTANVAGQYSRVLSQRRTRVSSGL